MHHCPPPGRRIGLHAGLPRPSHDGSNGALHLRLERNHIAAHLTSPTLGHRNLGLGRTAAVERLKVVLQVVLDEVNLTSELQGGIGRKREVSANAI